MFEEIFQRKKLNIDKLLRFGFEANEGGWTYDTAIMDGTFLLHISILENGDVNTDLVERETNEPYILYKTNASGTFVGEVRGEIEAVLTRIAEECFEFSDEVVEIIDLRFMPEQMVELVDNERYFPGWHMNKKSWYTIILDGSVSTEEICARIDESYKLAKKK